MTITNLSDLGGIVCVDGRAGEDIITAKADGSLKAGAAVTIIGTVGATQGDIDGAIVAGTDAFVGILLPKYNVDCDTAVEDGLLVEIVRPKAGRKYNVNIKETYSDAEIGIGGIIASNDGKFDITVTDVEAYRMCDITHKLLGADDDHYTEVIWRA